MNAPRSWPNSSASISVAGSAVQFTSMNGLPARGLRAVDRAGDETLAGAGLAADEHGGCLVERGDLPGLLEHRPDRRGLAHDAGRGVIRAPPALR